MGRVRLNMRSYSLQSGSCELLHSDILYVPLGHPEVKEMWKVWLDRIQICQSSEYFDALQTLRWIEVEMVRSTGCIRFKSGHPFPTSLACPVCLLKVWKYPNDSNMRTPCFSLFAVFTETPTTWATDPGLPFPSVRTCLLTHHQTAGIATSRQTSVGPRTAARLCWIMVRNRLQISQE